MSDTQPSIAPVSAEHVRSALFDAREDFDRFRWKEREWLYANLSPLLLAIDVTYERAINDHGIEDADSALQGSILGGSIVRLAIETGDYSQKSCMDNVLSSRIGERGFSFKKGDDLDEVTLGRFYGQDAAKAISDIKTSPARTLCGMVVGVALIKREVPISEMHRLLL